MNTFIKNKLLKHSPQIIIAIKKLLFYGVIGGVLGSSIFFIIPEKYSNKISIKIGGVNGQAIQPPNTILEELKQTSFQEKLFADSNLSRDNFSVFSDALNNASLSGSGVYLNISISSNNSFEIEQILNSIGLTICKHLNTKFIIKLAENEKKRNLQISTLKDFEKIISKSGLTADQQISLQKDMYGIKNALISNSAEQNPLDFWMTEITTPPQKNPHITSPSFSSLIVRGILLGLFIGFLMIFL